jgi:hypothetical protein
VSETQETPKAQIAQLKTKKYVLLLLSIRAVHTQRYTQHMHTGGWKMSNKKINRKVTSLELYLRG